VERENGAGCGATGLASWAALIGAIGASQVGQALLKAGATGLPEAESVLGGIVAQLLRWPTMVGLGFYGGGVLLYMIALRRIPMSVALPCTAVSFAVATVVGALAFGEHVSERHVAGLALVCAGVVLLARTTQPTEEEAGMPATEAAGPLLAAQGGAGSSQPEAALALMPAKTLSAAAARPT
jgi:small multidrug resistance pump